MKKRKIISIVVSLALAFGSMASLVVTADDATTAASFDKETILPVTDNDGVKSCDYEFLDIAHHDNTYVVLARKSSDWTMPQMYYSTDGAETWANVKTNIPYASIPGNSGNNSGAISSNKSSQQQLVWLPEANKFVMHGSLTTHTSSDGITWANEIDKMHWSTTVMLTTSGKHLVMAGNASYNVTNYDRATALDKKDFAATKYTTSNVLWQVVGAKPANEDGEIYVLASGNGYMYDATLTHNNEAVGTANEYKWTAGQGGYAANIPKNMGDMVYATTADQFLAIENSAEGSDKLFVVNDAKNYLQVSVKEGVNVVGVAANDDNIVVGLADGTIYYTANEKLTAETTWTEIPVMEDMTAADEPIKAIELSADSSFVALGTTQIYKGSIENGYRNINEKIEATPTPTAEATPTPTTEVTPTPTAEATPTPTADVTPTPTAPPEETVDSILDAGYRFVDVARNGDTYVALARERQDEGTYDYNNPKLYYSTDGGATWTLNPLKFEDVTNNQHPISFNKPSQQQLFWWAENNLFVVHGSSMVYTSPDGITWTTAEHLQWTGNAVLVPNGEHIILGGMTNNAGALNVTNNDRNPKDFGSTKLAVYPMTGVGVASKPADNNGNITVLELGGNSAVSVSLKYNSDGTYTWNDLVQNQNQELPMSVYDMVYAEGAGQFLAVSAAETLFAAKSSKQFVKIKVKDGANVTGVSVNDEYIVVGMSDGTMYYTENAELTADTKWTEIPVIKGATKATEEIRNFEISEDGKFIALSLRQIYEGDIHIGYKNIKDEMPIPTPAPELSISYNDGTAVITGPEGTYAVLFAAYDDAGRLIELEAVEDAEIADNGRTVITPEKFTGEEGASGKLMLWDSLNGMTPLASAPIPFQ